MNEPHPLLIERVASGNASIDDEQMLLVACETHPELYRELALAMLEERHFANGMRQLFAAPIVNADTVELPKLPQQNMTEQGRGAPSAKKSIAGWMLAAAAMFVGVTGGFASGWLSRQLGDDSTTGTSSEIALQNNPQEQVFGPRVPPTNLANQTTSPFGPDHATEQILAVLYQGSRTISRRACCLAH